MTFVIDTGTEDRPQYGRIDYCQALQDAALDSLPPDAGQEDIDAALAKLIVADLVAPKTAKTVRMHFARYWTLVAPMAPASHDFVIENYAERLAELR
jgi:hypothetical protein